MDNARYNFTTFCVYHALYERRYPKRRERREEVKKTAVFEISILLHLNYFSFRILTIFKIYMSTYIYDENFQARKIDSLLYRYWDLSFDRYSDR